jgi:polar amino acid transport system permease protein
MDGLMTAVAAWRTFIAENGLDFVAAFEVTLRISAMAIVGGVILGFTVELARRSMRWARGPLTCYVEFFRGTPLLIQLFLLYYGGPQVGLVLDAEPAGILGMALYAGAYFAEIFHAGFASIPAGQREAAVSLGIRPWRRLWRIELPQMAPLVLPPGVNQSITLIKDSAMLSIITVGELTKTATRIMNASVEIVMPLCLLALLYWIISEAVATLCRGAEARLSRHLTR